MKKTTYIYFFLSVINLHTNRCVRILGKPENARFLKLSLFQGTGKKKQSVVDVETAASENPALQNVFNDPTLFCTAFKKNRFYLITRREAEDTKRLDFYYHKINLLLYFTEKNVH